MTGPRRVSAAKPPPPEVQFTADDTGLVRSWMAMDLLALDSEAVTFGDTRGPWRLVIDRRDWNLFGKPDALRVWAETEGSNR